MACSGIVLELAGNGYGVIARNGSQSDTISMHVWKLVNGGEGNLVPGVPVTYDIENGAAMNVSILGLPQFSGVVQDFDEGTKVGHIRPNDGIQPIAFQFDAIFRILPQRISAEMEVTYNLSEGSATNIRFPASALNYGIVKRYNARKAIGVITPQNAPRREVFFHRAGVINAMDVQQIQGAPVTFEYERVRNPLRSNQIEAGRIKNVRATNIRIQNPGLGVIQEVQHYDAAARVTQSEAATNAQEQPHAFNIASVVSSEGYAASNFLSSVTEGQDDASLGVASSSDEVSLPQSAVSAPADGALKHCLPTDALVMTQHRGPVEACNVRIGDELQSLSGAKVVNVLTLQSRDRCFVDLTFQGGRGSLMVTSSHVLRALRPGHRIFAHFLSQDLQSGDVLSTLAGEVVVERRVEMELNACVVEIELDDPRSTMFVSSRGEFIEAFGALPPRLHEDVVKILTFRRHDNFREALLESEELQAIRRALEAAGFDADLGTHRLGLGKMLVPPHLAWPTLLALYTRRSKGQHTSMSRVGIHEVVVSRATEGAVHEAIQAHAGNRACRVVSEEYLTLPPVGLNESGSRAAVTYSTNPDANPRVRQPSHWDSCC